MSFDPNRGHVNKKYNMRLPKSMVDPFSLDEGMEEPAEPEEPEPEPEENADEEY